jgi:hypothetical protein
MVELGRLNTLEVIKQVEFGVYLDGDDFGEILLPQRYVPAHAEIGEAIEVFVYLDSEDQPIATTETPKIMVDEIAVMTVKDVNQYGAFLDWGLSKDLFVPFNEQHQRMEKGRNYVVYAYVDDVTERIAASSKVDRFLADSSPYFKAGQAVDLIISGRTDLGFKAIVDGKVLGLIFKSDAIRPLRYGMALQGFIKNVRSDNKLDICLQLTNKAALDDLSQKVLTYITEQGGVISLTDKSSPDDIANAFGVSKGSYKKALGKLYKQHLIEITPHQVSLVK